MKVVVSINIVVSERDGMGIGVVVHERGGYAWAEVFMLGYRWKKNQPLARADVSQGQDPEVVSE